MKKKISTVMLITIFMFSAFTSTASAQTNPPLAAEGGALDFVVSSRSFSVDYCNEYIIAQAVVKSPSNSTPEVLAEINGVNITMLAPLMKLDEGLNNKYFSAGITYYAYVNSPTVEQYNLTVHAGNSSGYVASTMYQYEYNKTMRIQNLGGNGTGYKTRINCTDYLFYLREYIKDYECVTSATVNINGTVYTMSYQPFESIMYKWDYSYTHKFGVANVDRTVTYNFSVNTATGSYFVSGGSFIIRNATDETEFNGDFADERYNNKFEVDFEIEYYDGLNRPLDLKLSINGSANETVSLMTEIEYEISITGPMLGVEYNILPFGNEWIWCDEVVGYFTLKFEYGFYYNVSLWWSNGNGTWIEEIVMSNMFIPTVDNLPAPTVEFSGLDATVQNGELFISGNITVTSDITNFGISGFSPMYSSDPNTIFVEFFLPEVQYLFFAAVLELAVAVDALDTNFADGKVYFFNTSAWDDYREFWGDIILKASLTYGNTTETKQASFNRLSIFGTITRTAGATGEYKVKSGQEFVFTTTHKVKKCCDEILTTTSLEKMSVLKVAYERGSDVFVINYTMPFSMDGSYAITVINMTLNPSGSAKYLWNNVGVIAPLNDGIYDKMLEYMNEFPLEVAKGTLKSNPLTGITTFSYNQTIGDLEIMVIREFDKNGVLRSDIFQKYLKGVLIYENSMVREMSFIDKLFLDYLWYAVVGVVALVAIVVIVMKMKAN